MDGAPFLVRLHFPLPRSQNGADVQRADDESYTALMLASEKGHSDIAALLLQVLPPPPFPKL